MLKLNQRGFSVLEVILIIVIVLLIGGAGFYVWKKNDNTKTKSSVTSSLGTEDEKKNPSIVDTSSEDSIKIDYATMNENGAVNILQKSDTDKLVSSTDSFKTYIKSLVAEKIVLDKDDCPVSSDIYQVSKIYNDRVAIGQKLFCLNSAGARRVVWVKQDGTWRAAEELGGQDLALCSDIEKYKVPVFIQEECIVLSPETRAIPNPVRD